jgi:hypothetical protein
MTTCSVSPERHSTTLYTSGNGLDWVFADIVLDHQNKDMLIFEGLIGGQYWAQTRPLGDLYFAYPPGSEWRAGPSINLATSPDALHWKPHLKPGIRPHAGTVATARMGAGRRRSSPMRGGSPCGMASSPRRSWASIAPIGHCWTGMTPAWCCAAARASAGGRPRALRPIEHQIYLRDVVFTTGIVDQGDRFVVASGEGDLACRITHVLKADLRWITRRVSGITPCDPGACCRIVFGEKPVPTFSHDALEP